MRSRLIFIAVAALLLCAPPPGTAQTVSEAKRLDVLPAWEMRQPVAAWDGDRYLLVFEAHPESQPELTDLYLAILDREGHLEGSEVRALGLRSLGIPREPSLAVHRESGTAMLSWVIKDGPFSDIGAAWLGATRTSSPAGGLALTSGDDAELRPSVGSSAEGFLVAWARAKLNGGTVVTGQRFGPDGARVDSRPEPVRAESGGAEMRPHVLGERGRYLLTWDDVTGLDTDGFLLEVPLQGDFRERSPRRLTARDVRESGLSVARLGERYFAVWQDFGRQVPDAFGARLTPELTIDRGPLIVTQTDGRTNEPEIAGDENGALVIWQDLRSGRTRGVIEAGRIDTAGRVLEPAGIEVLAGQENLFEIALAEGPGAEYLAVAVEDTPVKRLVFAIIDAQLAPVPEPPPDAGVIVMDTGNPRRDAGTITPKDVDSGSASASVDAGPNADSGRPTSPEPSSCRTTTSSDWTGLLWISVGIAGVRRRARRPAPPKRVTR